MSVGYKAILVQGVYLTPEDVHIIQEEHEDIWDEYVIKANHYDSTDIDYVLGIKLAEANDGEMEEVNIKNIPLWDYNITLFPVLKRLKLQDEEPSLILICQIN